MKKSKPVDDFDQLLDTASGKLDDECCKTRRRAMKRTADQMGSTPKEVLNKLLESADNNGNGKLPEKPSEAPATPSASPSLIRRIASTFGF